MPAALPTIVAATRQRVDAAKRTADVRSMQRKAESHTPRGFRRSLDAAGEELDVETVIAASLASFAANIAVSDEVQAAIEAGGV